MFDKDMTGFIGVGQLRYSQSLIHPKALEHFVTIYLSIFPHISSVLLRYQLSMSSNEISFGSLDKSGRENER